MTARKPLVFLGDVHGRFDHIEPWLAFSGLPPCHLIFLGDIQSPVPFMDAVAPLRAQGHQAWFIHGNHDTDSVSQWAHLETAEAQSLHGRVVDLGGVRVAGLGGVFRQSIWRPDTRAGETGESVHANWASYERWLNQRTPTALRERAKNAGKLLKHRSSIFPDTVKHLMGQRADVLVMHEALSCHPYEHAELDALARRMGVKWVVHGHHHESRRYAGALALLGFNVVGLGLRELWSDVTL